jgi:hypothetical protein
VAVFTPSSLDGDRDGDGDGDGNPQWHEVAFTGPSGAGRIDPPETSRQASPSADPHSFQPSGETVTVRLSELAHGRSGDKGDTCNIGVIARHPAVYPWMVEHLTAKRVREAFTGISTGEVERFEVPNIDALNFLLHEALGGGGTLSLHIDAQGKTYSHALLSIEVEVDRALLDLVTGN